MHVYINTYNDFLERTNSSAILPTSPIAQHHSLTHPFTPTQRSQCLTNASQLNLSNPHIGFTQVPTNMNISSSPLDTYPTNENASNQSKIS